MYDIDTKDRDFMPGFSLFIPFICLTVVLHDRRSSRHRLRIFLRDSHSVPSVSRVDSIPSHAPNEECVAAATSLRRSPFAARDEDGQVLGSVEESCFHHR